MVVAACVAVMVMGEDVYALIVATSPRIVIGELELRGEKVYAPLLLLFPDIIGVNENELFVPNIFVTGEIASYVGVVIIFFYTYRVVLLICKCKKILPHVPNIREI